MSWDALELESCVVSWAWVFSGAVDSRVVGVSGALSWVLWGALSGVWVWACSRGGVCLLGIFDPFWSKVYSCKLRIFTPRIKRGKAYARDLHLKIFLC